MKCSLCGYHKRGEDHHKGEHHLRHKENPGKYLPGTQTVVPLEED